MAYTTIIFDTKEECLAYYRRRHPDWTDIDIIRTAHLYERYPDWFEYPEFTEEEKAELEKMIKEDEEYFARMQEQSSSHSQKTQAS